MNDKAIEKNKPTRDEFMAPIDNAKSLDDLVTLASVQLAQVSQSKFDGAKVARLVVLTRMAAKRNPDILKCTRASLFWAILDAARCGLEWDGVMGALIPYKNKKAQIVEVQFQPMYQGLIHIVGEAGVCVDIDAVPVFKGEKFRVLGGTSRGIEHEIDVTCDRTLDALVAVYAVFHLRSGAVKYDVMSRAEIIERKNVSRSENGPWNDWPIEMAKKTVIKRGLKLLPRLSTAAAERVAATIDIDTRGEIGDGSLSAAEGTYALPGMVAEPAATRGVNGLRSAMGMDKTGAAPPADPGPEMSDADAEELARAEAERKAAEGT